MPTRQTRPRVPLSDTKRLHTETLARLTDDRIFWDDVVCTLIDPETRPEDACRIMAVADAFTAGRRDRFPI